MKGLAAIPSLDERVDAYNQLQVGPLTQENLVRYFQWARLDPRLGEILVESIAQAWRMMNPFTLRQAIIGLPWTPVMGVLFDHVSLFLVKSERVDFNHWKRSVMAGLPPAPDEQFFIGLRAFAGKLMRQDAEKSLSLYRRWGYLARDLMFNKEAQNRTQQTSMPKRTRLRILHEMAHTGRRITVSDYVLILDGKISRRVAELDLSGAEFLKGVGQTRSRFYVFKGKTRTTR